ncbi:MAG TPA: peptide-methionine (S)-S-oxide reductase MsrA [Novimethylophilus sp.]|jgi:peptide-methionine (S)-S-oxide reductase|uniref:peptide-methionine (S)-S-oxide reductase MsrA n=1 Tax=Novimethylophilus sp. TaxID=2137426 RepID=UPI002F3EF95D
MDTQQEVATLAGGCFWCLEAVFRQLHGVSKVVSGFIGGQLTDPSYKQVCGGMTGHAEAVQVTFDPNVIAFGDLLEVFFASHNPTTLNRQGNDIGTQYRSGVFYHSDAQRMTAEQFIAGLNARGEWPDPVVTEVTPASRFYPAENYHQDYFANNTRQPYCQLVVLPKVLKVRQRFAKKVSAG